MARLCVTPFVYVANAGGLSADAPHLVPQQHCVGCSNSPNKTSFSTIKIDRSTLDLVKKITDK